MSDPSPAYPFLNTRDGRYEAALRMAQVDVPQEEREVFARNWKFLATLHRVKEWNLRDDSEHGLIYIEQVFQDETRTFYPLFRYDATGHVVTIYPHILRYFEAPKSYSLREEMFSDPKVIDHTPGDATLWSAQQTHSVAYGDNMRYFEADWLYQVEPGDWPAYALYSEVLPEWYRASTYVDNDYPFAKIDPMATLPGNGLQSTRRLFLQHIFAKKLGIDVMGRILQIERMLYSKLEPVALAKAVDDDDTNVSLLKRYNLHLRRGESFDEIAEHQPGVRALYDLIYRGDLERRTSSNTKTKTHETFLDGNSIEALRIVKHAIGDVFTKGEWKYLTGMNEYTISTLFRYATQWIPLYARKKPGWLFWEPRENMKYSTTHYRWDRNNMLKTFRALRKFGVGQAVANVPKDRELVQLLDRYTYQEVPQLVNDMPRTQEEQDIRAERLMTNRDAFLRAWLAATPTEHEQVQTEINTWTEGNFGPLSVSRMLDLVNDWLMDIQPVLDHNQIKAPLIWWYRQQAAWHEAANQIPTRRNLSPSEQERLAMTWTSVLPEGAVQFRTDALSGDSKERMHEIRVVPLTTGVMLQDEGRAMNHCVGSYALTCHAGESRIFSVQDTEGNRLSTLQLKQRKGHKGKTEWYAAQNHARFNAVPTALARVSADHVAKLYTELEEQAAKTEAQEISEQMPPPAAGHADGLQPMPF